MIKLGSKRHVPCVSGTGAMGVQAQNRTDAMLGNNHPESGFSLIEVMIVCAIIGIASAIAIPNYVEWKSQYDLREAVSEFASNLNLARVVAMNRNRQATVTIQVGGGGLINVSGSTTGANPIFSPQIMNSSVTGLPGGTTNVFFSSMGLSTAAANQVIQLTNTRGVIYSVVVMPSGKVTWCVKPTCP